MKNGENKMKNINVIIKKFAIGAIVLLVLTVIFPPICSASLYKGRISGMELDSRGRVTKFTLITDKGEIKEINVNPAHFSMETHNRLKEAYYSGKLISIDCAVSISGGLWLRKAWIYKTTASGVYVEYFAGYWMYDYSTHP